MMSILDSSFKENYFLWIKGITSIFSIFITISYMIINELNKKIWMKNLK
jgi:hypothetical protein